MAWTHHQLRTLFARTNRHEFAEGEVLFREGDPGDRVFLIRRGLVEIYTESLVGRRRLSLRGRGEVIGEMALLDGLGRSASALARTRVLAYSLERVVWDSLLEQYPSLVSALSRQLSQRMRQLQATLASELDRRDAPPRLSRIGPFRLQSPLGEGGMGVIYAAEHVTTGQRRAVKVLPVQTAQQRELFNRECESMARLVHPHIVRIDSGGVEGGHGYVSMELLVGETLEQRLARGPLREEEVWQWFGPACLALAYAHEQGVVHRDLKPANLFLTRERVLKVLDFGIARRVNGPQLTVDGRFFGTPQYLAPERIGGSSRSYERLSDLYSLGATMYRALTGVLPFPSEDVAEVLAGHLHRPVPSPGLSAPMEALVLQLLAKDPLQRPASFAEVGQRLAELHGRFDLPTAEYLLPDLPA